MSENDFMAEMEMDELRRENERLKSEIAELQTESDLDACHIAGLTAQIKALIAESEACPSQNAHPLVQKESYIDSRSGKEIVKTRALPLYRAAFDAEAQERGIKEPELYRS